MYDRMVGEERWIRERSRKVWEVGGGREEGKRRGVVVVKKGRREREEGAWSSGRGGVYKRRGMV